MAGLVGMAGSDSVLKPDVGVTQLVDLAARLDALDSHLVLVEGQT